MKKPEIKEKAKNITFKLVRRYAVKDPSETSNYEKINDSEDYKVFWGEHWIGDLTIRLYVDHDYFHDSYHFSVNEKWVLANCQEHVGFPGVYVKDNKGFTHDDIKEAIVRNLIQVLKNLKKKKE